MLTTSVLMDCLQCREFLTGFRKRKNERRKKAQEEIISTLKEEKRRIRRQVNGQSLPHYSLSRSGCAWHCTNATGYYDHWFTECYNGSIYARMWNKFQNSTNLNWFKKMLWCSQSLIDSIWQSVVTVITSRLSYHLRIWTSLQLSVWTLTAS